MFICISGFRMFFMSVMFMIPMMHGHQQMTGEHCNYKNEKCVISGNAK